MMDTISKSIDDAQTLLTEAGNDPTHSQLAKDHDDHPLHELAVLMAQYAVRDVGKQLINYWNGSTYINPIEVAESFILHPDLNTNSDGFEQIIIDWANKHPENIKQATFLSVVDEIHSHADFVANETKSYIDRFNAGLDQTQKATYEQFKKIKNYFSDKDEHKRVSDPAKRSQG